ncbi:Uncharacterised protein [Neisseria gonorrhoeae]|nr:Uncharacterised protein [Neisseria gonorrhoeae]
MFPLFAVAAVKQPARQVFLVQALHNQDNRRVRAVLPGFDRVLKPVDDVLPPDLASRFICFVRVVNDDAAAESLPMPARTETCNRTARTCCVHHAACGCFPVMAAFACQCQIRKNRPILFVLHQVPNLYGVIDRQRRRIARVDKLAIRHAPHRPRDKVHDRDFRFRVSRRNIDNQAFRFAVENTLERVADWRMVIRPLPNIAAPLIKHPAREHIQACRT